MTLSKSESFRRLKKTMETGYNLGFKGKKAYEKRAELYEDRFKNL